LAVLGAWVAVLQTNAGTNESSTARDATRLAAEAQSAAVVEQGGLAAVDQIEAEIDILPDRPGLNPHPELAAELGVTLDPAREAERQAAAQDSVGNSLTDERGQLFDLQEEARRLSLTQDEKVEERVTWNARASQYDTVLTVLGVSLFLIGFTAVVGRILRPPLAVPGLLLAVFCFGWAAFIYNKPIPSVSNDVITDTATGQALLDDDRPQEAADKFSAAIDADDDYLPAYVGRARANLLVSNPDIIRTLAFTDTESEAYDEAIADLIRSIDLGGEKDVANLTTAAMAQIGRGRYRAAAETISTAIEVNDEAALLPFARSAVAVAEGNGNAARLWRSRGIDLLGPLAQTDRNRRVAAIYYTLLGKVADDVPEQADLARQIRDETVTLAASIDAGRKLSGEVPDSATLRVNEVAFADGKTTIDVTVDGVTDDAHVMVIGYERPAPDAGWVQPIELLYSGPPPGDGSLTIDTPRHCDPVEWRFDLYVEGGLADSVTAPGVAATC
jgi:tetratricopeptide (TPR) repeat protein